MKTVESHFKPSTRLYSDRDFVKSFIILWNLEDNHFPVFSEFFPFGYLCSAIYSRTRIKEKSVRRQAWDVFKDRGFKFE